MEVINLCDHNSLVGQFMSAVRDRVLQQDRPRFRANILRLGQIMAYEISKRLNYKTVDTVTPLGVKATNVLDERLVLGTVLRAGLPFHEGFLSYFDNAENAFVSAYREYIDGSDDFDVKIEYIASPRLDGKTLFLVDPMLAKGLTMELAYKALLTKGEPARIHVVSVIATDQGIDLVRDKLPADRTTLWTCDIDHELNEHSYIIPGLGDCGDLLYGVKE